MIKLFAYSPSVIEIPTGGKITWTNADDIEHSVTDGDPEHAGGLFDSELFGKDGAFTFTFREPGTYAYFCKRHNSMVGKIIVT